MLDKYPTSLISFAYGSCLKWGYPKSSQSLDRFSIETHGDWGMHHSKKTSKYVQLWPLTVMAMGLQFLQLVGYIYQVNEVTSQEQYIYIYTHHYCCISHYITIKSY